MNARRSVLLQLLALALAIAMSASVLPFLHGAVPTHWGLSGRPDAWGSPAFALAFGPAVLLGLAATSFGLIRTTRSAGELFAGLALMSAFFLGTHGLILGATIFRTLFPVRPLLTLVFGLYVGLGPIMAKVEQNPWFGVRTPWTLGSRRVWRETHRATGRLWLVGGLLGAAITLVGVPLTIVVAYLVLLSLAPVAISYRVWKRLGRP